MAAEPIKQAIELNLDASGIPKNSLAALIKQLEQVEAKWKSLDAVIAGSNQSLAQMPRKVAEIQTQLAKAQTAIAAGSKGGKGFSAGAIAQALGADAAAFEKHLAGIKKGVDGYHKTIQQFRNLPSAARAFAEFESKTYAGFQKRTLSMRELLRPTVGSVHGTGSLKVDGVIPLSIPAAQVQASVVGTIQIAIPGDQIIVSGGGRNEKGQFTGGAAATAEAPAGKKSKKEPGISSADREKLLSGKGSFVLRQDLVSGKESVTITELQKAGQTLASTFEQVEGRLTESRRVTRGPGGLTPLEQFRQGSQLLTAGFQADVARLHPSDIGYGMASLYEKQASQMGGMLPPALAAQLSPAKAKAIQSQLDAAAEKLRAQASAARSAANEAVNTGRTRQVFMDIERENPGARGFLTRAERQRLRENALAVFTPAAAPGSTPRSQAYRGYGMAQMLSGNRPQSPVPPSWMTPGFFNPPAPPTPAKPTPLQKALQQGFTPEGFATHIVKVAGWAAAVTTLYKSWELVHYSMSRVLDVGMQMSHLQVIFKGQGGSVRELTDDILGLAAAQGRSTDEAMEAATEWSRLGLSRSQVNTATTASMMAANVAQMHTTETTKQLMSLMHIYHLQVSDLNSELGKLVYTSQHYNVTLEDLFQGLDRAAPQARQMGMGLSELSGMIAGTVGKTGQSGVVVGNTIKYVLQEFNRPQIQQMLRGYGIETTQSDGTAKGGPQILRDLFVKYQGLDDTGRRGLTNNLAGRFHGARFVGMMDSYLESQKLAIDSQLNLNAAQTANAAILDTLQNKLVGLRAEWDRFVNTQANTPSGALGGFTPMDLMKGGVGGITNGLRALDNSHQSLAAPVAVGAGFAGAFATRAIYQSLLTKEAAGPAGGSFLLNMARRIGLRPALMFLSGSVGKMLTGPIGMAASLLPMAPALGTLAGTLLTAGGDLDPSKWHRGDAFGDLSRLFRGRSGAAAGRANLFQTTSDLLGIKNPDAHARGIMANAIGVAASEMSATDAGSLNKAFGAGDYSAAKLLLAQQSVAQNQASMDNLKTSQEAALNSLTKNKAQLADMEAALAVPYQPGGVRKRFVGTGDLGDTYVRESVAAQGIAPADVEQKRKAVEDLKKIIEDTGKEAEDATTTLNEMLGGGEEFLERHEKFVAILKQEQELLAGIAQLAEQGGTGAPVDRLAAQQSAAEMQVGLAADTYKRLQDYVGEGHEEARPAMQEAWSTLVDAKANRDVLNSQQMKTLAELSQNREIQNRRTDIETGGVGYTETERLLNQRQNLTADRAGIAGKKNLTPEDDNRALRDSVDLYHTNVSLAERMVALKKQEQQIMVDSNREFQKALLFAGPGELLKRLYVSQVGKRRDPMSTGEFMSWSPDMKQMYYQQHGGDAGAKNREEQGLLGAAGVDGSYAGEISQGKKDQTQIDKWRKRVGSDAVGAGVGLPSLTLPGQSQMQLVLQNLQVMGSHFTTTSSILRMVNGALMDFLKTLNGGDAFKQTRQNISNPGLAPGWALGATIGKAILGF